MTVGSYGPPRLPPVAAGEGAWGCGWCCGWTLKPLSLQYWTAIASLISVLVVSHITIKLLKGHLALACRVNKLHRFVHTYIYTSEQLGIKPIAFS